MASNILIHREYTNAFPAKLIIERGQVRTENSNKPHGFGLINPATFSPFPKNPVIASFFREIGRADTLGSGMRKMMKYGKLYGGQDPQLTEGDVFRIIVKYPDFTVYPLESRPESRLESRLGSRLAGDILILLKENLLGKNEIAKSLGHQSTSAGLHKQVKRLLNLGYVEMTLPDKPNSRLQKYRLTANGLALLRP